jgi:hypothetical protein
MQHAVMNREFTVIDAERAVTVPCTVDGERVAVREEVLRETLGWELKPAGLCKGDTCTPVSDREALLGEDGVDLAALAHALRRPLALDAAEGVAVLGTGEAERAARLATLEAPDFALPDLSGRVHALSEQRGKKVLLIVYASW